MNLGLVLIPRIHISLPHYYEMIHSLEYSCNNDEGMGQKQTAIEVAIKVQAMTAKVDRYAAMCVSCSCQGPTQRPRPRLLPSVGHVVLLYINKSGRFYVLGSSIMCRPSCGRKLGDNTLCQSMMRSIK